MIRGSTFSQLLSRHNNAIQVIRTTDIKHGNRCAMVMGIALHLYPRKDRGEATMRDLATSPKYKYQNLGRMGLAEFLRGVAHIPFMHSWWVEKYDESVGPYDQPFMDRFFVKAKDLANCIQERYGSPEYAGPGPHFLRGQYQKGVRYLAGFWHDGTGDHIDLWDGEKLNVTGTPEASRREINGSRFILLWAVP